MGTGRRGSGEGRGSASRADGQSDEKGKRNSTRGHSGTFLDRPPVTLVLKERERIQTESVGIYPYEKVDQLMAINCEVLNLGVQPQFPST